jgi:hypothetical protein
MDTSVNHRASDANYRFIDSLHSPQNGWQPYFTLETKEREIKEGLCEPITKHIATCDWAQAQLYKIHSTSTYPSVWLLWLLDTRACWRNSSLFISFLPVATEDKILILSVKSPRFHSGLYTHIYQFLYLGILTAFYSQCVSDYKVLRRVFGPKKVEVPTGLI